MLDEILQDLIDNFAKLPGIGPKSAQRLAFWILTAPSKYSDDLVNSLINVKQNMRYCTICGNATHENLCVICKNPNRNENQVCVVEEVKDLLAIESTGVYKGKYHVLGGVINPIEHISPNELRIESLLEKTKKGQVKEIILATNPTVQGEATATYLSSLFQNTDICITRIARGIPMGADIEFADELTLSRALENRSIF